MPFIPERNRFQLTLPLEADGSAMSPPRPTLSPTARGLLGKESPAHRAWLDIDVDSSGDELDIAQEGFSSVAAPRHGWCPDCPNRAKLETWTQELMEDLYTEDYIAAEPLPASCRVPHAVRHDRDRWRLSESVTTEAHLNSCWHSEAPPDVTWQRLEPRVCSVAEVHCATPMAPYFGRDGDCDDARPITRWDARCGRPTACR